MPPLRTSMSSKPMKMERTHEENQERAYIAASRRSDRGLEARVESARRLPRSTSDGLVGRCVSPSKMSSRKITQNTDFTRRLQAYMVNHVAMRQAVGQAAVDGMQMNNDPFHANSECFKPGVTQLPQHQPVYPGSTMPSQIFTTVPYGPTSSHAFPTHSNSGSSTARSHSKYGTSPQQLNLLVEHQPPFQELQRPAMQASEFEAGFDQQLKAGMHPFTVTLPMESQQMLADSSLLDPSMSIMFRQNNYSYTPNGKPRINTQPSIDGGNQKLMCPPLDTTFRGYDPRRSMASPQCAFTDLDYIPLTSLYKHRMEFDSGSAETMYKPHSDGSGNFTLQDLEYSNMFDFQKPLTEEEQWLTYKLR
ncbi:hypothetical protein LTR22_024231 [Elasticomyces elasticus]|nr:hypothetical protein LTR22_024231 [Elasticomyces elasticus]